jgi:hypothetical protein
MVSYWAVVQPTVVDDIKVLVKWGFGRHEILRTACPTPAVFTIILHRLAWDLVRASAVTLIAVNELPVALCPNNTTILLNCPSPHRFSLTTALLDPDLPVAIKLFILLSTLHHLPLLKFVSLYFDVSSDVDFVYHISRRYGLCKVCSVFNFEFRSSTSNSIFDVCFYEKIPSPFCTFHRIPKGYVGAYPLHSVSKRFYAATLNTLPSLGWWCNSFSCYEIC